MAEVREALCGKEGVGFVPTMGALHKGHARLLTQSREENRVSVLSIFVNPLQFGPSEDLAKYPRTLDGDLELAEAEGVDLAFVPVASQVTEGMTTTIEVHGVSDRLEGERRPGHFAGVATIVCKLFNIVRPERAYFGLKDLQQCAVIRRMVRDLAFPVEIVAGPTVREADGLAMSSRNAMLKPEERAQAVCLRRALDEAQRLYRAGERSARTLEIAMRAVIAVSALARVDYIELVDDETLEPVDRLDRPTLVALAVKFPSARLIDNVVLRAT